MEVKSQRGRCVEGGGLITLHFPRNPAPSTFGMGRYFVSLSPVSLTTSAFDTLTKSLDTLSSPNLRDKISGSPCEMQSTPTLKYSIRGLTRSTSNTRQE